MDEGQVMEENVCVDDALPLVCETGYHEDQGTCVIDDVVCEDGYTEIEGYCIPSLGETQDYITFMHDGIERQYVLHLPENLASDAPLVFMLHGLTGSSETMMRVSSMNALSDEHGFAVVYPEGTTFEGTRFWNAGLTYSTVDDVGFLVALATYLQETHDLSTENTFSAGFSNGGFMSYKLACDANDTFKAIGSVAGVMSKNTWDTCDTDQVPVLHIHGDADSVVPVDGTLQTIGGWGGAPELSVIIASWVTKNELDLIAETIISDTTTFFNYYSESSDIEVWYYKITDYNHIWPGSINANTGTSFETAGFYASDVIWEFFSGYITE